jgi:hypothetical protein
MNKRELATTILAYMFVSLCLLAAGTAALWILL